MPIMFNGNEFKYKKKHDDIIINVDLTFDDLLFISKIFRERKY